MVEHLVAHNRTKLELQKQNEMKWTIIHFYFDFSAGKGISNSFEGLMRSLLYQLIKAIPQLDVQDTDGGKRGRFFDLSEHRLPDVLRTSLKTATGGVCIFVDGLDEYEGEILDLIQFLKSLATSKGDQVTSIKVCVSSRPEPIPSQLLQHLPNLSMSDQNASSILSYCLQTLGCLEPEDPENLDISRLSRVITEQAKGVFLWVRFALDEVVKGYCGGESFEELIVRLQSFPDDLKDVYDRMLSRIEQTAKQECMFMLQLVCFAKRSLSWKELVVATDTAMDKDVSINERIHVDDDSENAPKAYSTFAKRLRAKAVGLLELVKAGKYKDKAVKLIHRSVSTYLDQKGWQSLGALEGGIAIGAESLYVKTCTRYLHRLLCRCNWETCTISKIRDEWGQKSPGVYPFFEYASKYVFVHAKSVERHGSSSYPLLHDALTEQVVYLNFHMVTEIVELPSEVAGERLFERFDAIFVAFFSGLVLYCTNDVATRSLPPGQVFWEHALTCALTGVFWRTDDDTDTVSLALQNVITVKQAHLNKVWGFDSLRLVLQHESIESLQLVDRHGEAVTLLRLFAQTYQYNVADSKLKELFNLLIERANGRGEDVRQRCGPEGNLVETLMKKGPDSIKASHLPTLRDYYKSMSWPFEYDSDEIDRFT